MYWGPYFLLGASGCLVLGGREYWNTPSEPWWSARDCAGVCVCIYMYIYIYIYIIHIHVQIFIYMFVYVGSLKCYKALRMQLRSWLFECQDSPCAKPRNPCCERTLCVLAILQGLVTSVISLLESLHLWIRWQESCFQAEVFLLPVKRRSCSV